MYNHLMHMFDNSNHIAMLKASLQLLREELRCKLRVRVFSYLKPNFFDIITIDAEVWIAGSTTERYN